MSLFDDDYDDHIRTSLAHANDPRNVYYQEPSSLLRDEYRADVFGDLNAPWTTARVIITVFKLLFIVVIASYIFFSMTK